jgi:DNA-directed RNA polymerase subunit K/omega
MDQEQDLIENPHVMITSTVRTKIIMVRSSMISQGAPILCDVGKEKNPIRIATIEFENGLLPFAISDGDNIRKLEEFIVPEQYKKRQ